LAGYGFIVLFSQRHAAPRSLKAKFVLLNRAIRTFSTPVLSKYSLSRLLMSGMLISLALDSLNRDRKPAEAPPMRSFAQPPSVGLST
jgi:hypothetical protein